MRVAEGMLLALAKAAAAASFTLYPAGAAPLSCHSRALRRRESDAWQIPPSDGVFVKRDLLNLAGSTYDLIIVGGGIFGAAAAWDATLRGLRVALVEKGDFAHATSANSFKMVHGGIRYLQHGDLARVRESVQERRALLRIAPHLVEPLPILVPTYGRGMKGKGILRLGVRVYDAVAMDRNQGIEDPARRIPPGRFLSREECLGHFPDLEARGLTGGVLFHDAQMYNPPRLALAFLRSAVEQGAVAANYVRATGLLRSGQSVNGIEVQDARTGDTFEIHGKAVLNAAGPWAERLLARFLGLRLNPPSTFSRDACFVLRRRLSDIALAVPGNTRDPDALLSRQARHLFLVPWRESTLVGVWHAVYSGQPEDCAPTPEELQGFLNEINQAHPALGLTLSDVATTNSGLVLFGQNEPGAAHLSYGKRSRIVDHAREHGVNGLVTMIGVRYTTARGVAARAVDLVTRHLGRLRPRPPTHEIPLHGGAIPRIADLLSEAQATRPEWVPAAAVPGLVRNYGSEHLRVLACGPAANHGRTTLGASANLSAEVVHAVRAEMALTLQDVVFRRTDLATAGHPGNDALLEAGKAMGAELGWSRERLRDEVDNVDAALSPLEIPQARARISAGPV